MFFLRAHPEGALVADTSYGEEPARHLHHHDGQDECSLFHAPVAAAGCPQDPAAGRDMNHRERRGAPGLLVAAGIA
jgi:hypothetical protein